VISGPDLPGFDINDPAWLLPEVNGVKTKVAHDPDADTYTLTWDRKSQVEYLPSFSFDLSSWLFTGNRFLLSLQDQADQSYTITGATWDKFFSRVAEVSYALTPRAPENLIDSGKIVVFAVNGSETVTVNFTGSGAGTWISSNGGSGNLTSAAWSDAPSLITNLSSPNPQAKFIPIGRLKIVFDGFVGSEQWKELDFETVDNSGTNRYINFHTPTTGWCDGLVTVAGPGGIGTAVQDLKTSFSYTP